ncbi:hypothetical protein VTO42DRAFT_5226 [Malbranchea cinnamomea]
MIHPCVVFCSIVHSYGDGNLLARPSIRPTLAIVAFKSTHDVCVVFPVNARHHHGVMDTWTILWPARAFWTAYRA